MKALLLVIAFTAPAFAHPAVGVVVDSKGNIFYSDLRQIWRLAANGALGIAVPNVHSHEIYMDPSDNLYGEHVWYNGEQLNTWGSRVWRRSPDGRVIDIVASHAGFNENWGPVHDAAGNMYIVHRPKQRTTTLIKCSPACRPFSSHHFENIRFMTATASGTLYLVDLVDLVKVTPDGRAIVMARNLGARRENHQVMGVWTDRDENVYVADYGDRAVKRVDKQGQVEVIARSSFPWAPSGGTFARNGDMIVLETKVTVGDETRVVRIGAPRTKRSHRDGGAPF